jgi:hypothetical protein
MNMDNFEKRLQRQPWRQVPGEWREEILAAASAPERRVAADKAIPLWRLIFARFPVAWGALAAVWIALIAINVLLFGSAGISSAHQRVANADEPLSIWHLQSAELRQLASGDQSISGESPANLPAATPRSPRSDRRRDDGVGEIILDHSSNLVA